MPEHDEPTWRHLAARRGSVMNEHLLERRPQELEVCLGDAVVQRMSSDEATGEGGNLASSESGTSRERVMLEGSRAFALDRGAAFLPTLEVGLRQDGNSCHRGAAARTPEHVCCIATFGAGTISRVREVYRPARLRRCRIRKTPGGSRCAIRRRTRTAARRFRRARVSSWHVVFSGSASWGNR